jgi:hypothetical protein
MSIYEHYSMNIPLFFPSQKYLKQSSYDYISILKSSGQITNFMNKIRESNISKDEKNYFIKREKILYDINTSKYLDWFSKERFKHLIYFDSDDHLIQLLEKINLNLISIKMKKHNEKVERDIKIKWIHSLYKIFSFKNI